MNISQELVKQNLRKVGRDSDVKKLIYGPLGESIYFFDPENHFQLVSNSNQDVNGLVRILRGLHSSIPNLLEQLPFQHTETEDFVSFPTKSRDRIPHCLLLQRHQFNPNKEDFCPQIETLEQLHERVQEPDKYIHCMRLSQMYKHDNHCFITNVVFRCGSVPFSFQPRESVLSSKVPRDYKYEKISPLGPYEIISL